MAAGMLSVLGANAQSWEEPEAPSKGSEVVSGHKYRVKNVAASAESDYNPNAEGYFLTGGASWYSWATSTVLRNENEETPLTFTVTETADGWVFQRTSDNKYTFISGATPQGIENSGEMHVDQGSQAADLHFFGIQKAGEYYRVYAAKANTAFNIPVFDEEGNPTLFWGWMPNNYDGEVNNFPWAVYGTVNPDEGWACDWEFIDYSVYEARLALYNKLNEAVESDYADDNNVLAAVDAADKVYGDANASIEALEQATKNLNQALATAKANAFLKDATLEDPVDATELIENANFDAGNIGGWVCTFVNGVSGTNIGYQGASYNGKTWTNEDGETNTATLNKFIEAWANNNDTSGKSNFNPNYDFPALGDGKLYQIMLGLPAGLYKLTCNANAHQQAKGEQNPVTGVQLYAIAGQNDMFTTMATGNGVPEHFELKFVHSGGDVELGLRTQNTNANWIAADDFTLMYYGEVEGDPQQIVLEGAIADAEKKFNEDNIEDTRANTATKNAYIKALGEAKTAAENYGQATEYYVAANESFTAAYDALTASVDAYNHLAKAIGDANDKAASCEKSGWQELAEEISDEVNKWEEAYENGNYTDEEALAASGSLSTIIADYISENCKAGDDVTILLENPGFNGSFDGWKTTGAGVVYQENYGNGENQAEAGLNMEEQPVRGDGLAERWHAKFSMYQTIKNMPRGLYTLSCQGFNRHDDGEDNVSAELYAELPDGSVQTAPFAAIQEYATADKLYDNGDWQSDSEWAEGWVPNSMTGSAWHFMNKSDGENYDYQSKIDIVLTEQGDLTLGARCEYEHQWVIFDNFRIIYRGSGANVYEGPIKDRIAEGSKFIDEALDGDIIGLTQDVQDAWDDVCAQATKALDDADEDACIKAINDLTNAIADLKANNAEVNKLAEEYTYNNDYRAAELEYASDALNALLDEIGEALTDEGIEKASDIDEYIEKMNAEFNKSVIESLADDMADATEDEPVELIGLINNPGYNAMNENSTRGWTIEQTGGFGYFAGTDVEGNELNVGELYNQNYDMCQKIYGLKAGFYRLMVQGFYRSGFPVDAAKAATDSIDARNAVLYAGDAQTNLVNIFVEKDNLIETGADGSEVTVKGETFKVPNSMEQAANCFAQDWYWNILQFEVTEAAEVKALAAQQTGKIDGAIAIGIKKAEQIDGDWTIFQNWKIEYIGTAEPSEDPTTAVESISNAPIVAAQYFNVNGTQQNGLRRGVNIVKATKADGTVKMVKVLVK